MILAFVLRLTLLEFNLLGRDELILFIRHEKSDFFARQVGWAATSAKPIIPATTPVIMNVKTRRIALMFTPSSADVVFLSLLGSRCKQSKGRTAS
jgi:hypothetical protein